MSLKRWDFQLSAFLKKRKTNPLFSIFFWNRVPLTNKVPSMFIPNSDCVWKKKSLILKTVSTVSLDVNPALPRASPTPPPCKRNKSYGMMNKCLSTWRTLKSLSPALKWSLLASRSLRIVLTSSPTWKRPPLKLKKKGKKLGNSCWLKNEQTHLFNHEITHESLIIERLVSLSPLVPQSKWKNSSRKKQANIKRNSMGLLIY